MKLFSRIILLLMVAVSAGCSRGEDPDNTVPESIPLTMVQNAISNTNGQILETENLPGWLSEFINSLAPDDIRDVAAFQAKWKGEDVYYVYNSYSSCIGCDTFNSEGEAFDWSKIDPDEFWRSLTDWKCIYLRKSKLHDL